MKPRDKAIEELNASGYEFKRHGGNHDIYYNSKIGSMIPLKRHDFNENDLTKTICGILKTKSRNT